MRLTAKAPGRICLFGEHQDYLGLPVIAAAITREMTIDAETELDILSRYRIVMHDMDCDEIINMAMPIVYRHHKDYLRSVIKTIRGEKIEPPRALTAEISSTIPIEAGTSSSAAMSVAWTSLLLKAAGHPSADDPLFVARLAHHAEVVEFRESGGMMDQITVSHGGLVHFAPGSGRPEVTPLRARPAGFVLGDSRQPKDTQAILSRVRGTAESAIAKVSGALSDFDLTGTDPIKAADTISAAGLGESEYKVLVGNLENRDILRQAQDLLSTDEFDPAALGNLLNRHHEILRDNLRISTDKIEAMIDAARAAGALGCKINGSGGGGCMFAYAPGCTEAVAAAIEGAGGKAYPIEISEGLRVEVQGN